MRAVIVRGAKYLVLLLGIGVALAFLGAQLEPLLTVVIILAAVALLALRGVAENFGAGVVLQTRKPVKIGDEIESQGYTGVVAELNGRAVVITTSDGHTVHLPNAEVLNNPLTNHSENGSRRSEIEVRYARRGGDGHDGRQALIRCALATGGTATSTRPGPPLTPPPKLCRFPPGRHRTVPEGRCRGPFQQVRAADANSN